jgi:hypothetical protein
MNAFIHRGVSYVAPVKQDAVASIDNSFKPENKLNQDTIMGFTYKPASNQVGSDMARQAGKLALAAKEMMTQGKTADYKNPDKLYSAIGEFMSQRPAIVEDETFEPVKGLLQGAMAGIQHAVNDFVQLNYQHQMPTDVKSQGQGLAPLPTPFDM